jgi:hypothetical protein
MKPILAIMAAFAILLSGPAWGQDTTVNIPETQKIEKEVSSPDDSKPILSEIATEDGKPIEQEISPADFLTQIMKAIQDFGGLPTVLKIASIIMLIISSMKVSLLRKLLWDKLGDGLKPWIAPLLGLIAGILGLASDGEITLATVFAYISAGAGAIILHELLDSVKKIPGIGPVYQTIIDLIQAALLSSKAKKKS